MARSILILFLLFIGFAHDAQATPARIIILRHAEKISEEDRNLSPQGFLRAEALVGLFSDSNFQARYGKPVIFFAASPGIDDSLRSIQTITPTAKALATELDSTFKKDSGKKLMTMILQDTRFDNQTVVICWNRDGIKDLMRPLNSDELPNKWGKNVFNFLWILNHDADGSWGFESVPQGLLPGDTEAADL